MSRTITRVTNVLKCIIIILLWLAFIPFDLTFKLIKIITNLNTALRDRILHLILYLGIKCECALSHGESFLKERPIGQIYLKIKISILSPRKTVTLMAERIFGQPASLQLEQRLATVEQRAQNHGQRLRTLEGVVRTMRGCRCHEVVLDKGKARDARNEDEAPESSHQNETIADLGTGRPANGSVGLSRRIQDLVPRGTWRRKRKREDIETAGSTGGLAGRGASTAYHSSESESCSNGNLFSRRHNSSAWIHHTTLVKSRERIGRGSRQGEDFEFRGGSQPAGR